MDKVARFFLVTALVVSTVQAAENQVFFKLGGSLQLRPAQAPRPITSVSWKHNGDLVAEWVEGAVELEFYGVLENRTTMDKLTAELKITNMVKENEGVYTVEINDRVLRDQHKAVLLKEVSKVEVVARPLTCSARNMNCTLICHSDLKGVEPVTYYWKVGQGHWVKDSETRLILNNKDEKRPETFSCRIKNAVSEKDSEPLKNPFLTGGPPEGLSAGAIVGLIFLGLILLLGVFLLLLYLLRDRPPFSDWWAWLMRQMGREASPPESNGMAAREQGSPEEAEALETNAGDPSS